MLFRSQIFSAAIAKHLAFVLLMERDAVLCHERHEMLRRIAGQGRAAKVRVLADEVVVRHLAVGEVGPPATGDADFFGHLVAVVDEQHLQAQLPRQARAKQAGCACAKDSDIKMVHKPDCAWRKSPR